MLITDQETGEGKTFPLEQKLCWPSVAGTYVRIDKPTISKQKTAEPLPALS